MGEETNRMEKYPEITAYRADLIGPELQCMPIPKREIWINPLDRGYMIRVGCQSIAVESVETLIEKLEEYLRDPLATENKYNEKTLFK